MTTPGAPTSTKVLEQRLRQIESQLVTLHRTHAHIAGIVASRRTDGRRNTTAPTTYRHPEQTHAHHALDNGLGHPEWPDPLPAWAITAHRNRVVLDALGTQHVRHYDVARVSAYINNLDRTAAA